MILKLTILLSLVAGASLVPNEIGPVHIQGYKSITEVIDQYNNTVVDKLINALNFTLSFSDFQPYGLLSYTTPDVLLFFQLYHSILKDDIVLTNLIFDVSKKFRDHPRSRTRSASRKNSYKNWLDRHLNFSEEDVYKFVQKISLDNLKNTGKLQSILLEHIFLLDGKYKIIEKCFKRNDPVTIEFMLTSGFPTKDISKQYLMHDFNNNSLDVLKAVLKSNYINQTNGFSSFLNVKYVDNQTFLHIAAQVANKEEIFKILREGFDINALDSNGFTPIYKAVESNNLPAVEALIDSGANLNFKYDPNGNSLLHLAVELNLLDIFLLILKKIPIITMGFTNENGDSLLHYAAKLSETRFIEELLLKGADINYANDLGETPLHISSSSGNLKTVQFLLKRNARLDVKDYGGFDPLLKAIKTKNIDVINLILETKPSMIKSETYTGDTVMHLAVTTGDSKFINYLLKKKDVPVNKKNKSLQTPFYMAVLAGNVKIVKLLKNVTDLGSSNSGLNMLHEASTICNSKAVEILLEAGIEVNSLGLWRNTALHLAAGQGCANLVPILLKYGAIKDKRNKNNLTPLHLASIGGYLDVVTILVKACADSTAADSRGRKPVDLAEKNKHIHVVKFLNDNHRYCF